MHPPIATSTNACHMATGPSFGGKTHNQHMHLLGRVRMVTTRLAFVQAGLQLSDWLDHCGGVEKFWREVANYFRTTT